MLFFSHFVHILPPFFVPLPPMNQAAAGIGASLRDWMHCADANLDLDPVTLTGRASDMAMAIEGRVLGKIL